MSIQSDAFQANSDVNLWFKLNSGSTMMLTDYPDLIALRWQWLQDKWSTLKATLVQIAPSYVYPDYMISQINDLNNFIEQERSNQNSRNPFQDKSLINRFYTVFDNISVDSANISYAEQQIIDNASSRVTAFTRNNFLDLRAKMQAYSDLTADISGMADTSYNDVTNRSAAPVLNQPSITDVQRILSMQNAIKSVTFILANLFAVEQSFDPFLLARQNANNPDVNIGQYSSGKLVKLRYGEDLRSLANAYLGSPDKWIDIAIANGLKPPYIDEVGQSLLLISNGGKSQINIAENDVFGSANINRLFIGQTVFLSSNTQVAHDQRKILNITQVPISGEIVIELDGINDLNKYKTIDNASMLIYAPHTANSGVYVLIPSSVPLPSNRKDEVPWFLTSAKADERRAKIDLEINDDGDIPLTSNGDVSLSFGLDNAIQAIKLKIVTELGSLRYHPNFGLVSVLGSTNADIASIKSQLTQSLHDQIGEDSRFDRIESLSIDYVKNNSANVISISLSVRLAGGSTIVPITFSVRY